MRRKTDRHADPTLAAYYSQKKFEYNLASMCKMSVPLGLEGLTVLDIGCRRGRGVFKLSDRVGDSGHVIGIDWTPDFIDEAIRKSERAWRETGLKGNNMEFHVGYPEDLAGVGIADETIDLAFINSVLNLAYDYDRVLAELYRVLKPGGTLICETVLANCERDEKVMAAAREIGNNVQSAPSKAHFDALVKRLGFEEPVYLDARIVEPDAGFKHTYSAPTINTDEQAVFVASVSHLRK